jgi:hypothetical protein
MDTALRIDSRLYERSLEHCTIPQYTTSTTTSVRPFNNGSNNSDFTRGSSNSNQYDSSSSTPNTTTAQSTSTCQTSQPRAIATLLLYLSTTKANLPWMNTNKGKTTTFVSIVDLRMLRSKSPSTDSSAWNQTTPGNKHADVSDKVNNRLLRLQ